MTETAKTETRDAAKMETIVALVRVPERVAKSLRYGRGSLIYWAQESLGSSWEADFDGDDPDWEKEAARLGASGKDRECFDGLDVGFVEAGSEAEKSIMDLVTLRADSDTVTE